MPLVLTGIAMCALTLAAAYVNVGPWPFENPDQQTEPVPHGQL